MLVLLLCTTVFAALLFIDIPWIGPLFPKSLP
jgi:hypothetical protein